MKIGTEDKRFYKMLLTIAVPMMIQNGLSNFVSLLDNLMIGRLGTNALSGVSIANQLLFVYNLMIFGAIAGVGIFTAQYHGIKNEEGVRNTFRFKIVMNLILACIAIVVFIIFGSTLISTFLQGEGSPRDAMETLDIGNSYLRIMLVGLFPLAIAMAYSGTLRETGETSAPMKASLAAVLVNLVGNFILIYGYFGLPAFGAGGAAIATVISRIVELAMLAVYTNRHSSVHTFIKGAYKHLFIPGDLAWKFFVKSLPLMCNEVLWAAGTAFLNQCYSYRSLSAVAAQNIQSTLWNLLGVAFIATGECVGIIIGQQLGKGDIEKAKGDSVRLLAFTVFLGLIFGLLQIALSPFFPRLYNTTQDIRDLATKLLMITGTLMPVVAYAHAAYFIIRAGGRVGITFLFDSCFTWLAYVPAAYFLSRYTDTGLVMMFAMVQSLELPKALIGALMVHSGIWAKNIVK